MKFKSCQIILCFTALMFASACAQKTIESPPATTRILERNLINCFDKGLKSDKGKMVQCETSAAAYTGDKIILGSDKPIPGPHQSSIVSLTYKDKELQKDSLTYFTEPAFLQAVKYEDFTLAPDKKYIIATTGFDRVKAGSNAWDGYNTLLFWPRDNPGAVKVANPVTREGITSSLGIRSKLSAALATQRYPRGMPYFKVEGIAAVPGNKLLFGIRELGAKYNDFNYAVKIVSVPYHFDKEELILGATFSLVYDYNPEVHPLLNHRVALSSIEYDPYHDRLYLLTSFEEGEKDESMGGYLWTLPIKAFNKGCAPKLVMKDKATPLIFAHKAEGLAVLDESCVFVIHDDDRVLGRESIENPETQFHREPHQAAYTIISFSP